MTAFLKNRGLPADDPQGAPKVEAAPGNAGFKGSTRNFAAQAAFSPCKVQGDADNPRLICVKIFFNPL
jgi:hypothetical protein